MNVGDLDATMQAASEALVAMRYLEAERRCEQALDAAVKIEAWAYVARILLPLQEARRQRRMICADASVTLGTADRQRVVDWAAGGGATLGCLLVTLPCTIEDARAALAEVKREARYGEVLFAETHLAAGEPVIVVSLADDAIRVEMPPPDRAVSAADWFLDACEALGDRAIAWVDAPLGTRRRFDALYGLLEAAPDHEKLHQRLADAARALIASPAASG